MIAMVGRIFVAVVVGGTEAVAGHAVALSLGEPVVVSEGAGAFGCLVRWAVTTVVARLRLISILRRVAPTIVVIAVMMVVTPSGLRLGIAYCANAVSAPRTETSPRMSAKPNSFGETERVMLPPPGP
jgi:hypothetical protein